MVKGVWKGIKSLVRTGLVGASLLLPREILAWQNQIGIRSYISDTSTYGDLSLSRVNGATDGYDGSPKDIKWLSLPPSGQGGQGTYGAKIVTFVGENSLRAESISPDSTKNFEASLIAVTYQGHSFTGISQLGIKSTTNSVYKGFDPQKHYVGEYSVSNVFRTSEQPFYEKKDLRALVTNANIFFVWEGPTDINIPSSQTNTQGEVTYGKFSESEDWNRFVSTSEGPGANSWAGSEIMNYNSDTNVTLNANDGSFVDKYIVTRTGNTGDRTVTTNDIPGQDVSTTNITVNGIKGSNSVHAIYGTKQYPVTITTSGAGSGNSSWTNANVYHGDITNVVINAGVGSELEAIVEDGITNKIFNPATNSYNYTSGTVTNSKTIEGVFDLKKFLIDSSVSGPGSVNPSSVLVPYGESTTVVVNADSDYQIADLGVVENGSTNHIEAARNQKQYPVVFNTVTSSQTLGANFSEIKTDGGAPFTWFSANGITNDVDKIDSADPDSDGFNNLEEYISDTKPTNSLSYFPPVRIEVREGRAYLGISETSTGRVYGLDARSSLSSGTWESLTNRIQGTGTNLDIDSGKESGTWFFKSKVGLP